MRQYLEPLGWLLLAILFACAAAVFSWHFAGLVPAGFSLT